MYLTKFDVPSLRIIKNMNIAYNNLSSLLWMVRAVKQEKKAQTLINSMISFKETLLHRYSNRQLRITKDTEGSRIITSQLQLQLDHLHSKHQSF